MKSFPEYEDATEECSRFNLILSIDFLKKITFWLDVKNEEKWVGPMSIIFLVEELARARETEVEKRPANLWN